MKHAVVSLSYGNLAYNTETEEWTLDDVYVEGHMSKGVAVDLIAYVRRCEENARREFAEVVRLYSLIHKVDPSSSVALSSPQSPPEEPT